MKTSSIPLLLLVGLESFPFELLAGRLGRWIVDIDLVALGVESLVLPIFELLKLDDGGACSDSLTDSLLDTTKSSSSSSSSSLI